MPGAPRILYVDDEPGLLEIGKLFLEGNGDFSVTTIDSALSALDLIKKEQFDAIISDYQMPGMDGIQFLVAVRTRFGSIPFILFTGKGREEVVINAINNGADFYLQKGGDPEAQYTELINKIRYAVQRRTAEKEVSEAGERYKAFISVSNTGAWEFHDDTGFLWCSPEYHSMLGRDIGQFDFSGAANLREVWIDLLHPEDRERADRHFRDYLANGSLGLYENYFRMLHSDGHWVWIWSRGRTLRDMAGNLTHKTVGTHIDITESKLAEEGIINNNERLRMAQEIGQTGSWELDIATGMVWASDEAFRIFSIPRPAEGIISIEDIEKRIPEREMVHRALLDLIEKGADYNLEYVIEPSDKPGRKIVHSVAKILFDSEKKPARVAGVIHDITIMKMAEEQALLAKEEWERTFNAVPDLVCILDTQYTIRRVNQAMAVKLGVTPEKAVGLTCYQSVHGTQSPPDFCPHAMLLKDHKEHTVEIKEGRLGGQFLVTCTPLLDKDGLLLGSVHVAHNITDRKRVEEALKTSQFQLAEAMDLAHLANWEFDVGTGTFTFNDRFYALYGTTAEQEGGCQMTAETYAREFLHPDDQHLVAEEVNKAIHATDPGYTSQVEHRIIRRDGEVRHILVRFGLIKDADGRTIKTHGANQDITDLKIVQDAVIRMNETLSRQTKSLSVLNQVITTANNAINRQQLLHEILDKTLELLDYNAGGIYLIDHATGRAGIACSKNMPPDFLREVGTVSIDVPPYDSLFIRGIPLFTENYEQVSPEHFNRTGYCSLASIPLLSKNRIVGALNIASSQRHIISEDEQQILISIGRELGSIIERMSAEEELNNAAKQLKESESRLNSIIRVAPAGIGVAVNRVIQAVNDQFCQITGYTTEELVGKPARFLYPTEEDYDYVGREKYNQIALKGQGSVETRFRRKDGAIIDVLLSSTPIDPSDISQGVTFTTLDITERKRVEKDLRFSERKFAAAFEASPDPMAITDIQTAIIQDINHAFEEWSGYLRGEVTGKTTLDLNFWVHPGERDEFVSIIKTEGVVVKKALTFRTRNGNLRNILFSAKVVGFGDANIMLSVVEDITDRKKDEDALKESEEKYRRLFETMMDAFVSVDMNGVIQETNNAFIKLLGYTKEELRHLSYKDLTPEKWHAFESSIVNNEIMVRGHSGVYEKEYIRKDGTVFPAELRTFLMRDHHGNATGMWAIVRDITERKTADMALLESEEKFRSIFNNYPDLYYRTDMNGIITRLSPSLTRLSGWTPEDLIGHSAMELYPYPEERTVLLETLLRTGNIQNYEISLLHKDGRHLMTSVSGHLVYDDTGKPYAVEGTIRDITQRKQAEEALRESEELFREVLNNASDAVFLLERTPDGPGRYLLVNEKAVRMLGYSKEELLQMTPRDIVPAGVQKRVMPGVREKLSKDGHATFESVHRRKDGSTYPIEVSTHTFRYKGTDVDLSITRDISNRKRAEQALMESEAKFRDFFNNAGDAITIHDTQGRFLEVNDEICRRLGFSREELREMSPGDLDDPEYGKMVPVRIAELKQAGYIVFETVHIAKDGTRIPTEVSSRLISYNGKQAIISTARDITRRKQAENTLLQANRQLNLLGSITRHDINNKIAVLMGYLSIIETISTDPALIPYLEKMQSATRAIQSQIEFTRAYHDLGTHEPHWYDLDSILPRSYIPESIRLTTDVAGIEIFADPMFEKVFFNLLDNSIRHGKTVNEIRMTSCPSDGCLMIVWEDNGAGIPVDEKENIFERGIGKNTGLGLFLVREILLLTGITIHETGEPGRGARFEILVPAGMYR